MKWRPRWDGARDHMGAMQWHPCEKSLHGARKGSYGCHADGTRVRKKGRHFMAPGMGSYGCHTDGTRAKEGASLHGARKGSYGCHAMTPVRKPGRDHMGAMQWHPCEKKGRHCMAPGKGSYGCHAMAPVCEKKGRHFMAPGMRWRPGWDHMGAMQWHPCAKRRGVISWRPGWDHMGAMQWHPCENARDGIIWVPCNGTRAKHMGAMQWHPCEEGASFSWRPG
jgi:hypothetical protein